MFLFHQPKNPDAVPTSFSEAENQITDVANITIKDGSVLTAVSGDWVIRNPNHPYEEAMPLKQVCIPCLGNSKGIRVMIYLDVIVLL